MGEAGAPLAVVWPGCELFVVLLDSKLGRVSVPVANAAAGGVPVFSDAGRLFRLPAPAPAPAAAAPVIPAACIESGYVNGLGWYSSPRRPVST
jgi:hypothetical protein